MKNKYPIPTEWIVSERSNFYSTLNLLNEKINDCVKDTGEVHTKGMTEIIKFATTIVEVLQECIDDPSEECANPDLTESEIRYAHCISIRANSFAQEYLNNKQMDSVEKQYNEFIEFKK